LCLGLDLAIIFRPLHNLWCNYPSSNAENIPYMPWSVHDR